MYTNYSEVASVTNYSGVASVTNYLFGRRCGIFFIVNQEGLIRAFNIYTIQIVIVN